MLPNAQESAGWTCNNISQGRRKVVLWSSLQSVRVHGPNGETSKKNKAVNSGYILPEKHFVLTVGSCSGRS